MFDLMTIKGPADVKAVPAEKVDELCDAMRQALVVRASKHTGHVGPNLGFVEAAVALHRVFDSPTDRIVFDVSHQCYPHKMLTGRMQAYVDEAHYDDVSGYTEPGESPHDPFVVGHTSTSVSLATGLAKARDLRGETFNVIAVIGDGSLSGGEAFEGLNNAAEQGTNLIVVFNDNQMSIAEPHGGFYASLARLRATNGEDPCNFFKAMGFAYVYVADGNDEAAVEAAFRRVKDAPRPVVVHLNTEKGHGWAPAVADKEAWHWGVAPFDPATGRPLTPPAEGGWIGSRVADFLLKKMAADPTVVVVNAAVPGMLGFTKANRAKAGKQFVDVGICEEHAVAFVSALAKGGAKPVFSVVSTFVQRAYDQLSQDLCINDSPATILVTTGGLATMNDVTHLCWFDIPLLANIPNLVYLCPTSEKEYFAMLDWSIGHAGHPVAIREPSNGVRENDVAVLSDYSGPVRFDVTRRGKAVAILGLGNFYALGAELADALAAKGIAATLVNPRCASALDVETLDALASDHRLVVTLEDGAVDGGFGEKVARHYGPTDVKVLVRGAAKQFADRYDVADFLKANRLTVPQLVADCEDVLRGAGRTETGACA